MGMEWKRVNSFDELEVGDIVRINPENENYSKQYNILIKGKEPSTLEELYCNTFFYDTEVFIKDGKLFYENLEYDYTIDLTKDALYDMPDPDSWIEKLIVNKDVNICERYTT